ncbi:MAG: bifunctional YncE family protein/alkaline phosphatase family protein [Acidobacteria bacterium]|nr:bifunctional YncE family protein/alkaline phosphatase family protein [Acidobacteriota bacterium]
MKRSTIAAWAAVTASAAWGQMSVISPWSPGAVGAVTTQQAVTPAGVSAVLSGRVSGAAFDGVGRIWALAGNRLTILDLAVNRSWTGMELGGRAGWQGVVMDPLRGTPLVAAAGPGVDSLGRSEPVRLAGWSDGGMKVLNGELGVTSAGRLGVARQAGASGRRLAVIPLTAQNRVAVVEVEPGQKVGEIAVGQGPFAAVVNAGGTAAYVSNWGGRAAAAGDKTAGGQKVVVDERGIASTGTVTKLDLVRMQAVATIQTELHPTALEWDEGRQRLYAANSNSDSITVIDTAADAVVRHARVQPFEAEGFGVTPSALALTRDGTRLYVACAGINAVAVVRAETMEVEGLIPTGWYPVSVGLDEEEKRLVVGCLLGAGSGETGTAGRKSVWAQRGSVQVVEVPAAEQLRDYTWAVAANTRMDAASRALSTASGCGAGDPIPRCAEGGSPIKKVVLVVKENRTFDQVLGDLGRGNGAAGLATYGRRVTPNQHKLAEEFVTLDNLYATGIVSAEGHQWLTQAYAASYTQWQGYAGRTYPFDGTDPIAYSSKGFLWDLARAWGKTVRVFGEFAPARAEVKGQYVALTKEWKEGGKSFRGRWQTASQIPGLEGALVKDYPAYSLSIPDVVRAEIFLDELRVWTERGEMPDLTLVQLPANHTAGTTPGEGTPAAMVADNDVALGKVVEGLTKSPFWKEMAIFVVEDDAQDGVDHVDGHRTVGQAISPWTRRGSVDSTFYSHQSVVKTIELILGLPHLTLFDLIATDMRGSFQSEPDFRQYEHVEAQATLGEANAALSGLSGQARKDAEASLKMNWAVPDEAPWAELNRILWRAAKGEKAKYPGVRTGAALPVMMEEGER